MSTRSPRWPAAGPIPASVSKLREPSTGSTVEATTDGEVVAHAVVGWTQGDLGAGRHVGHAI